MFLLTTASTDRSLPGAVNSTDPCLVDRQQALDLCHHLQRLYQAQAHLTENNDYLTDHARPEVIKHHVNVFAWYAKHLPLHGNVLDWGCNHAPDSCMLRHAFGDRYELDGCDFPGPGSFAAFHDAAKLRYTQLTEPLSLPYADNTFDVVIAAGVLEHAAMDQEALKSLYRILKPGGKLIISYLPYRWSFNEWRLRVRQSGFHRRLYGWDEISTLLKRTGFYPLDLRWQTFVPDVVNFGSSASDIAHFRPGRQLIRALRYRFYHHDALCCIAQKMAVM